MTIEKNRQLVVLASPEELTYRMFGRVDQQVPLVSLELDLNEKRRLEQLEEMWRREVAKNEALQAENLQLQRRLEQLEEMWRREVAKKEALQGNYQESQERVKKLEELLETTLEYYRDVLTILGRDINILFCREEEGLARNRDGIEFREAGHLLSSSSNASRSEFSEKFVLPKMEADSSRNVDGIEFSEARDLLSSSSNDGRSEFSKKFAPQKMEVDSSLTKRTFGVRVVCEKYLQGGYNSRFTK